MKFRFVSLRPLWLATAIGIICLSPAAELKAQRFTLPVAFDRWMYPFNVTPGSRASGSVFGSGLSPDFDDRDAQLLLGFDVSSVQTLLPDHALTSIKVQLTTAGDNAFTLDPTSDSPESYVEGAADPDAGRPLELFGVGTRNGFEQVSLSSETDVTTFREDTAYSTTPNAFRSSRSAYAAAYIDDELTDISNGVSESRWAEPWAVGDNPSIASGALVPINTAINFAIALDLPGVASYATAGLERGELFFALTALHTASQNGPPLYPSFYLDASGASLGPTATLELEFSPRTPGDFDGDGQLQVGDLDRLTHAILDGSTEAAFDLDGNGLLTRDDLAYWVHELRGTWLGDANLDGRVDTTDLVGVFQSGQYEDSILRNSTWSDGDWNGDREFTTSDLVAAFGDGGFEQGPRAAVAAVPEPTSGHVDRTWRAKRSALATAASSNGLTGLRHFGCFHAIQRTNE